MDVMEAIRQRRSVRAYRPDPVSEKDLDQILEAARMAPSARNAQQWRFVVVTDADRRARLAEASRNQEFVGQAPVVIAAVALDPERVMSCGVETYAVDLAIAVDHMTLAAVSLGLGTCWIGAFDQDRVRAILDIPDNRKVVAVLPVGYPADEPREKSRKPMGEVACFESYRE